MDAVTWGFIGTIIGAITSIATTSIANWNTFSISKNAKLQDREERARSFQRETLLELQIELREYVLASFHAYRSLMRGYDETGLWEELIPVNENIFDLSSKISILIQRVSKDKLRSKLGEIQAAATVLKKSKDHCEARKHYLIYADIYERVHEQLGNELRRSY